MRKLISILLISTVTILFLLPFSSEAVVKVRGYYRKDGTYVQPHYRSDPDSNPYNNWSFPGNVNPYTGNVAPGNPDTYLENYYNKSSGGSSPTYSVPVSPSYSNPKTIEGGYYIGSYLFCNSGYIKKLDTCVKAPENSYSYGGESFYCNSGYYRNGDRCDKVPDNAYAVGDSWYCYSGFIKQGNQCVAPEHGRIIGLWLYCDDGYIARNNQCISYTQDCINYFGLNVIGTKGVSGNSSCTCEQGYEWNSTKTSCVKNTEQIDTSEQAKIASLQAQIQVLLNQIIALQKALGLRE